MMQRRISEKAMWPVVVLLAAVCAAQGYHLHARRTVLKPAESKAESTDGKRFPKIRKGLDHVGFDPFRIFDRLFSDPLFAPKSSPRLRGDRLHRGFGSLFPGGPGMPPMRSWQDAFGGALDARTLTPRIESTKDAVVVSLRIPGLQSGSLKIDIGEGRIKISYGARESSEEKDAQGRSYRRSESVRRFQRVMPIPAGADPGTGRLSQEGDVVKITFRKRD